MKVPGLRGVTLLASFHANETGVETLGCLFCVRDLPWVGFLGTGRSGHESCGGRLTDVPHLEYGT